ncbi:hypothetical protein B566_EDAN014603, partial [Ephemera danica]
MSPGQGLEQLEHQESSSSPPATHTAVSASAVVRQSLSSLERVVWVSNDHFDYQVIKLEHLPGICFYRNETQDILVEVEVEQDLTTYRVVDTAYHMDTLLVPVSCLYTPFFLDLFQHLTLQEQSLVKKTKKTLQTGEQHFSK